MSFDSDNTSFTSPTSGKGDNELEEFLMIEKQKAQFNAQVRRN